MLKIYMVLINTLDLIGIGNWEKKTPETVEVLGKPIETNEFIKFVSNIINYGSLHNPSKFRLGKCLNFTINTNNTNFDNIRDNVLSILNQYKAPKETYKKVKNKNKVIYNAITYHAFLNDYFTKNLFKEIHNFNSTDIDKLLELISKPKGNSFAFYTQSLSLANNIQILALKAGYAPSLQQYKKKTKKNIEYYVSWSKTQDGKYPYVIGKKNHITKEQYNGTVWCMQVPSGIFVTRRNGKIGIHGNSKYVQADTMINPTTVVKVGGAGQEHKVTAAELEAYRQTFEAAESNKNFKIFTHDGVAIERIGFGQGIYDISGDITQLLKEIYIGLMVPSVLMDGGADTSYANRRSSIGCIKAKIFYI